MQIDLQVPEGVETGQSLQFLSPDGRTLQATVPEGVGAGQSFSVMIPGRVLKILVPPGGQPGEPVVFKVPDAPANLDAELVALIPPQLQPAGEDGAQTFPFYLPPPAEAQAGILCREAQAGDVAKVQLAIERGASVNAVFSMGFTALFYAATYGHLPVAEYLLAQGADVNWANTEGRTALHWSCRNGHMAVTELLIAKGARLDVKDGGGKTPLMVATDKGQEETVKYLQSKGTQ